MKPEFWNLYYDIVKIAYYECESTFTTKISNRELYKVSQQVFKMIPVMATYGGESKSDATLIFFLKYIIVLYSYAVFIYNNIFNY